jgi:hypothetical protein
MKLNRFQQFYRTMAKENLRNSLMNNSHVQVLCGSQYTMSKKGQMRRMETAKIFP